MLPLTSHCVEEGLANFFLVKGQLVNILDFVDHMVSVTVIQFCSSSANAATDNM